MTHQDNSCAACGAPFALVAFSNKTFTLKVARLRVKGLSGQACSVCKEVFFTAQSAQRYADAGDAWVMANRRAAGQELKLARLKLKLTQRQASGLTGGGHNAFSRYERGLVPPMPAVINLFRLLARHPKLLAELSIP